MNFRPLALAAAAALGITASAQAATVYDSPLAADWNVGSGQSNTNFAVSTQNGVELGLRAQIRFGGAIVDAADGLADGIYHAPKGLGTGSDNALWNFDYSADLRGTLLNRSNLSVLIDADPSAGTDFRLLPLGLLGASTDQLVQDSQNFGFWSPNSLPGVLDFDPTIDGTYDVRIVATNALGATVNSLQIQIVVGAGGAPAAVPLPTAAMGGMGLFSVLGLRRKSR